MNFSIFLRTPPAAAVDFILHGDPLVFDGYSCVVNIAETRFKGFSVGPSLIELFD